MQQQMKITISGNEGDYDLQLTGNMTIKDMAEKYAFKLGKSFAELVKTINFVIKGRQYPLDSNMILSEKLENNGTVFIEQRDLKKEDDSIVKQNVLIRNEINKKQNRFRNHTDQNEKEEVKDILKDMAVMGSIENKEIEIEKNDTNKFISINECLNSNDDQFFILGIIAKYLQNIGIEPYIERAEVTKNENIQDNANTLLQFLCNGYILKHKYTIDLNVNETRREMLYNNTNDQKDKFFKIIKETFAKDFQIEEDKIIVADHHKVSDRYTLIITFKSNLNKPFTKEYLESKKSRIVDFKHLAQFEEKPIIESIKLNRSMLDKRGNNKSDNQWGYNEKRGGFEYLPPVGMHRYGLKVFGRYDNGNNDWLSYDNRPGEWSIAYSGLSGQNNENTQKYEYDMDIRNFGQKVGIGVYTFQNPKIMEEKTEIVNANGIKYKMGFMLRVKPDKIRIPQTNNQVWVINGTSEEIRPYGILLKKINY